MKTKLFKVAEEIRKHRETILFVDAVDACEETSFCLPPAHTSADVAALIAHMEAWGFRECETDDIVVKLTDGIMLYGDHLATYGGEDCGDNKNYVLANDFLGIVGECTIFDKSGDDYGKRNEIRTKLAQVLEGYGETTTGAHGMVQRMEDNAIFDRLWRGVGSPRAFTIWEVKTTTGIFQPFEDCKQYITINKILHKCER